MDPRIASPVAPLLAGATALGPGLVRVVAPNPSPLTLDGTNSYVVFGADRRAIVVDPGPAAASHLELLEAVVESEGVKVVAVVTTHSHPDHSEALELAGELFSVPAVRAAELLIGAQAGLLGSLLTAVPTPGHSSDHVCYLTSGGVLLTGDHVLGRGTTAVLYPDGNLTDYLASLARVDEIGFSLLAPGHGPALEAGIARATLRYYREHRFERLEQVMAVVEEEPASIETIVAAIYGPLPDPLLAGAAAASTLASLNYLGERGDLVEEGGSYRSGPR